VNLEERMIQARAIAAILVTTDGVETAGPVEALRAAVDVLHDPSALATPAGPSAAVINGWIYMERTPDGGALMLVRNTE